MKKVKPQLTTANSVANLGLWYAYRLASHGAAVNDEQEHDGVELERCTSEDGAKGDAVQDPAVLQPVSHKGIQTQRCRNGSALEECALASSILGQNGDSDVEAGQSGQSTQNKKGEAEFIGSSSKANGKGNHGGSDTERDQVGKGIQLLSHQAALLPPSSHPAIKKIEEQAKRQECQRPPQVVVSVGGFQAGL